MWNWSQYEKAYGCFLSFLFGRRFQRALQLSGKIFADKPEKNYFSVATI
jgi:hypothetical protein|tara:strand:- start:365 stop:511 length:147 start_codon:yes stop_codon:yes gene_type:complete